MSASGATVMARGVDRDATGVRSGGSACREFDVRSRDGEKWPRLAFEKHQCSRWYWRGVGPVSGSIATGLGYPDRLGQ